MYNAEFKTKKNGIPFITKKEIDFIGEQLVGDFCPEAIQTPTEINIDRFVEKYLGMEMDFQYLSHCGCYLGMTVFNDTDTIPVYCPKTNTAEYISAKAGTVIIDNNLLEDNQEHRYRFTVGHEGSHHILHSQHFWYNPNQMSMFADRTPMVKCRRDNSKAKQKPVSEWDDHDIMEWQANYLSSAILMPKNMVLKALQAFPKFTSVEKVALVRKIFNTSFEASLYRLRDLGCISKTVSISSQTMDFVDLPEITSQTFA